MDPNFTLELGVLRVLDRSTLGDSRAEFMNLSEWQKSGFLVSYPGKAVLQTGIWCNYP